MSCFAEPDLFIAIVSRMSVYRIFVPAPSTPRIVPEILERPIRVR